MSKTPGEWQSLMGTSRERKKAMQTCCRKEFYFFLGIEMPKGNSGMLPMTKYFSCIKIP